LRDIQYAVTEQGKEGHTVDMTTTTLDGRSSYQAVAASRALTPFDSIRKPWLHNEQAAAMT